MTQLKSLAHKDWPYAGTAHEWRGFVKDESKDKPDPLNDMPTLHEWREFAIYQKQNFGPDLD
jgi:hypothetical protein